MRISALFCPFSVLRGRIRVMGQTPVTQAAVSTLSNAYDSAVLVLLHRRWSCARLDAVHLARSVGVALGGRVSTFSERDKAATARSVDIYPFSTPDLMIDFSGVGREGICTASGAGKSRS